MLGPILSALHLSFTTSLYSKYYILNLNLEWILERQTNFFFLEDMNKYSANLAIFLNVTFRCKKNSL